MKEKKRLIVFLILFIVTILIIAILGFKNEPKGKLIVKAIDEMFTLKQTNIVFIEDDNCNKCASLKYSLDIYSSKNNFEYKYINLKDLNTNQKNKILEKLNINDNNSLPYLIVVENDEVVSNLYGYITEQSLFNLLRKYNFVKNDSNYINFNKEYTNISFIDYNGFEEVMNSDLKQIVVLGQFGCAYCESLKPVLQKLSNLYNIKINYLDLTALTIEEQSKLLSYEYFNSIETIKTPLTVLINNKKITDSINGFKDYDTYVSEFEEKFIKK